jgi:hypothetical protein
MLERAACDTNKYRTCELWFKIRKAQKVSSPFVRGKFVYIEFFIQILVKLKEFVFLQLNKT